MARSIAAADSNEGLQRQSQCVVEAKSPLPLPITAFLVVEVYFAFGAGSFEIPVGSTSAPCLSIIVLSLLLASHGIVVGYVWYASRRDRDLLKEHGKPYPAEFKKYLHDKQYESRLQQLFAAPRAARPVRPAGTDNAPPPR